MRFLFILMLLLAGSAQAIGPSEWLDDQAKTRCALDLRRLYGEAIEVDRFLGKQPQDVNRVLVGLVAHDNRAEYRGQPVTVGCIYNLDGSLVTIFFKSKTVGWTAPTGVDQPAKPTRRALVLTTGYAIEIPTDAQAMWRVLARGGSKDRPTLVTKRVGPSGTTYSEREFDCSSPRLKYLGTGDTLEEMEGMASEPEMYPAIQQSIAWYLWVHACKVTGRPPNPGHDVLLTYSEADQAQILGTVIRDGGDKCTPTGAAYRGFHTDGSVFYHVSCLEGEDFMVMIRADDKGTTSVVSCGVMALTGTDCRENL